MAKNKLAYLRYRAIDKCLSNRKIKYTAVNLLEQVNKTLEAYDPQTKGISRSQLYADLEYIKSSDGWNAEIEQLRDGKNVYLRYSDDDFSIQNMPLNELEITQLKEALQVLRGFKGMPQFEWMEEVTAKLQRDIIPQETNQIIAFDANQYLKGIEWLGVLYNAIQYKKALCVKYQDFKAEQPYDITFHAYYLKQYNNRWFVFGSNPKFAPNTSTLALDRIENIRELAVAYQNNTTINFEEYFEDIIGVSKQEGGVLHRVELLVAPERIGYVITKPLHGSQKISKTAAGLIISLDVIINNELRQLILSYGSQIEVISPSHLRENIKMSLMAALAQY